MKFQRAAEATNEGWRKMMDVYLLSFQIIPMNALSKQYIKGIFNSYTREYIYSHKEMLKKRKQQEQKNPSILRAGKVNSRSKLC